MNELNSIQQLLVTNWRLKNYQLSDVLINSLIGLTVKGKHPRYQRDAVREWVKGKRIGGY